MDPKIPIVCEGPDPEAVGYSEWAMSKKSHMATAVIHRKCGHFLYTGGYGFHLYCWGCHRTVRNTEAVTVDEWNKLQPERESIVWLYW